MKQRNELWTISKNRKNIAKKIISLTLALLVVSAIVATDKSLTRKNLNLRLLAAHSAIHHIVIEGDLT